MPKYNAKAERARVALRAKIQHQQPYTCTCLDVSTAHMTAADCQLLCENDHAVLTEETQLLWDRTAFGYSIQVNAANISVDEACQAILQMGFSKAFLNVLQWAASLDCLWVEFDLDGTKYEHLPKFDW